MNLLTYARFELTATSRSQTCRPTTSGVAQGQRELQRNVGRSVPHSSDCNTNVCHSSYLHNPYYFCTVSLWDAENEAQIKIEPAPNSPPAELLQGQLVSSLHRLKDFDNSEQGFFVFSDISVGTLGTYRLRFSLYEYRPTPGDTVYLAGITSEKFDGMSFSITQIVHLTHTVQSLHQKTGMAFENQHPCQDPSRTKACASV